MSTKSQPPTDLEFTWPDNEQERLESQHLTLLQSSGLLFHPSLGDLSQFSSILDANNGTTVWVEDILNGGNKAAPDQPIRLRKGCVVEACGIDPKHQPATHPEGLADYFISDLHKAHPFDQTKHERYDFINTHFFIGYIRTKDWVTVLENLKDCLKPGGSINLREVSNRYDSAGPIPFAHRFEDIVKPLFKLTGHHNGLTDALPDLLRQAGFVDIEATNVAWPIGAAGAHLGQAYVDSSLANARMLLSNDGVIMSPLDKVQGHDGIPSLEEAERVASGMLREVETVGVIYRTILVTAKKPLAGSVSGNVDSTPQGASH